MYSISVFPLCKQLIYIENLENCKHTDIAIMIEKFPAFIRLTFFEGYEYNKLKIM